MIERRLHRFDNPALAGVEFPLVDVRGAADGPTLCLLAGVHGCEYSSIQAVRSLVRELDPSELSGRVLALAFVNPASFVQRSPFVSPQDGKNPNRTFPGKRDGSFTEALTYHVFHELIEPSDYLIDLHGGDQVEALHPFVLSTSPRSTRLRAAWRSPSASRTDPGTARRAHRGDDDRGGGGCGRSRHRRGGRWTRPARAGGRRSAGGRRALRDAGARHARGRSLACAVPRALAAIRVAVCAGRRLVARRGAARRRGLWPGSAWASSRISSATSCPRSRRPRTASSSS